MPFSPLMHERGVVRLRKCIQQPEFTTRTILVDDQWDYIKMWLNREGHQDALFFWNQAQEFHKASQGLPNTSSPLTNYYSAMNATKAFLMAKGVHLNPYHGVTGETLQGKAALTREIVKTKTYGVFSALSGYLGEPVVNNAQFTLKDILYNLPYIHRAYTLTFTSQPELFIPVADPVYVREDGTNQCWVSFEVKDTRYHTHQLLNHIADYQRDNTVPVRYVVRKQQTFDWIDADPLVDNLARLTAYHRTVRESMYYIKSMTRLWYLKRSGTTQGRIRRSSLTLTYMALHRVSEISRYSPDALARHFDSQHNWVLSEFINLALDQYLDELAAELTGHEFMLRGYSPR